MHNQVRLERSISNKTTSQMWQCSWHQ